MFNEEIFNKFLSWIEKLVTNIIEGKKLTNILLSELKIIKNVLNNEFGNTLFNDNLYFEYIVPIRHDYLRCYHENINNLNKISNDNTIKLIIEIYKTLEYFIDCLITNNEILDTSNSITQDLEEIKYKKLQPLYKKIMKLFEELEIINHDK